MRSRAGWINKPLPVLPVLPLSKTDQSLTDLKLENQSVSSPAAYADVLLVVFETLPKRHDQ